MLVVTVILLEKLNAHSRHDLIKYFISFKAPGHHIEMASSRVTMLHAFWSTVCMYFSKYFILDIVWNNGTIARENF